jgi:hypothetical protein
MRMGPGINRERAGSGSGGTKRLLEGGVLFHTP